MREKIWKKGLILALALFCFTCLKSFAYGEKLTVAVLNFESKDKAILNLGTEITDLLTAELSTNADLRLVEREKLDQVLDELGLSKTGIVDESQAVKIGYLTGAKILVTGRAFTLDRDLVIVAKVIGTETSEVQAEMAKGPLSGKLTPIVKDLAKKVAKVISQKGHAMVAKEAKKADRIKEIRDKIGKKGLPKIFVAIRERHLGAPAIDPAAETEFIYILKKCGFTVATKKEPGLSEWAKEYFEDAKLDIPAAIQADVVILGEAFSEFGTRTGKLISSKARVEIQAIDRQTGKILAIDRKTNVAVDLSEQIAAKTAIQEAAAEIAFRLIPEFVETWNRSKK